MKHWIPSLALIAALHLPTTVVFGQVDTNSKADASAKADDPGKDKQEELTVPQQFSKLIQEKNLTAASELVNGLDQSSPRTYGFRTQLGRAFAMQRDYVGAAAQYEKQLQAEMAKDDFAPARIVSSANMLRIYMPRADRGDELGPMIDQAIGLVSKKADPSKASKNLEAWLQLRQAKSMMLRAEESTDDAQTILQEDYELTKKLYSDEESDLAAALYATAMRNLMPSLLDNDARLELLAAHQGLTSKYAENGNTDLARGYMLAAMSEISRTLRSDPEQAEAMLKTVREFMKHHAENEKIAAVLKPYERSISSYESRLESARKLLAMIGKPAPPMDADVTWIGIDEPIDTKGKVVLVDFWALWCGPCIATFPHLKHLSEEYGDKGFQIVGVTRYYNYTWDEEANRPKSGDRSADPNPDVENEVLKKFMASHELTHPTIVVSSESTMHQDFGVSGIPHVALIDQEGRIQMVKVGSGEVNARAIEAKIRELLGLSEAEATAAGE